MGKGLEEVEPHLFGGLGSWGGGLRRHLHERRRSAAMGFAGGDAPAGLRMGRPTWEVQGNEGLPFRGLMEAGTGRRGGLAWRQEEAAVMA